MVSNFSRKNHAQNKLSYSLCVPKQIRHAAKCRKFSVFASLKSLGFSMNTTLCKLSNRERHEIIKFCIFQYFRTSKLTSQFNDFWGTVLKKANLMAKAHGQPLKIKMDNGSVMDFSGQSIEDVIKFQNRKNQESINALTFNWALQLIETRQKDIVTVEKVARGQNLFTSNNPVYFFGSPFDSQTLIKMPLDNEHLLTIFPASRDIPGAPKYFFSYLPQSMSEIETTFNNLYHLDKAERFIVGDAQTIQEYRTKNENFDTEEYLDRVWHFTKLWTEQTEFIQRTGKLPDNFTYF